MCLNGLLGESIMAFADVSCMLVQFYDIAMPIHIHAHACKFPDMLCIEGFYSDIGSPLVASEGGRVVIQTAAGRGPGVAQAWPRRGPGVGQVCLKGLAIDSGSFFADFRKEYIGETRLRTQTAPVQAGTFPAGGMILCIREASA